MTIEIWKNSTRKLSGICSFYDTIILAVIAMIFIYLINSTVLNIMVLIKGAISAKYVTFLVLAWTSSSSNITSELHWQPENVLWLTTRCGGTFVNFIINNTSGYATWFTAGGAIRIADYNVIDDVITRKL